MINAFRKIRRKLADDNKPKKYLRYAIGEIALVVIGILIALQVNNWNESRKDRNSSLAYHYRITDDISAELGALKDRIEYYKKVRAHAESVIQSLTLHPDSLDEKFIIDVYQATQNWAFRSINDTYQELVASGKIKLIPDPEIRKHISKYYNQTKGFKEYLGFNTDYRELVRRHLPAATQQKIQNSCEINSNSEHDLVTTKLISDCDPNLTADEIRMSLDYLFNSKSLGEKELLLSANWLVADLNLKLTIFDLKKNMAISLLELMDSAGRAQ